MVALLLAGMVAANGGPRDNLLQAGTERDSSHDALKSGRMLVANDGPSPGAERDSSQDALESGPDSSQDALKSGRVLVAPLAAVDVGEAMALQITGQVAQAISQRGAGWEAITVVEAKDLLSVEELQSLVGCAETDCLSDAAGKLHAIWAVSGSVGIVGTGVTVNLSLTNIESGALRDRVSTVIVRSDRTASEVRDLVWTLFGWGGEGSGERFVLEEGRDPSFAVLDLGAAGVADELAKNLTSVLADTLKQLPGASVIAKDDILDMLKFESDKQILGCSDDTACLAEIGGALGVSYLVSGSIGRVAETYVISLRLMDPEQGRAVNRATESYQGEESQIFGALRHAARELVGLRKEEPGSLAVSASEPAKLFVDGADLGELPLKAAPSLAGGRHELRLVADDFIDWHSDVYVEPGAQTPLRAELVPVAEKWYEGWVFWTVAGGVAAAIAAGSVAIVVATQGEDTSSPFSGVEVRLPQR